MPTSSGCKRQPERRVYLIDTNVISEARKQARADPGVIDFLRAAAEHGDALYISVVSVGELRRGVDLLRYRGDADQAQRLDTWLSAVIDDYGENILPFDTDAAQVWGRLRVPNPQHELDKQIAATALVNNLTVVTRNIAHFHSAGVPVRNPFTIV